MMKFSIATAFPALYNPFLQTSLMARAQEKHLVTVDLCSFMDHVAPKERIDSPTFGPGPGMLIRPIVVEKLIEQQEALHGRSLRIFFSPQGQKLDQLVLQQIKEKAVSFDHILLVASRYEGIDARVQNEYADVVLSVGDYVLMGGDLPAMLFLESFMRLIPGVVGNDQSVMRDSFAGPFVDYPEYTEPVIWHEQAVPSVVRSGNHQAIEEWRQDQQASLTVKKHFAWLRAYPQLSDAQIVAAKKYIPAHYVALMHTQVLLPSIEGAVEGTTSVTSLDIHDGARSTLTYGIRNYFIVTPLLDQQKIVNTLLNFWQNGPGKDYNRHRYEALQSTELVSTFQEVIDHITRQEEVAPLVIATSARDEDHAKIIGYDQQAYVWSFNRPVLFVFGTGKGLSPDFLHRCDFLLLPVYGFTDFNHLSVRSAIAIILDRWLGINPQSALKNRL